MLERVYMELYKEYNSRKKNMLHNLKWMPNIAYIQVEMLMGLCMKSSHSYKMLYTFHLPVNMNQSMISIDNLQGHSMFHNFESSLSKK